MVRCFMVRYRTVHPMIRRPYLLTQVTTARSDIPLPATFMEKKWPTLTWEIRDSRFRDILCKYNRNRAICRKAEQIE